jgi:general secretion pathway protein D
LKLKKIKNYCVYLLVICLAGCANNQAFTKAKSTIEQGDVKSGFGQLKEVVSNNPNNLEYKRYYYTKREATISKLMQAADNARVNGLWEDAEANYNKVLEIDEVNDRAQDGIKMTLLAKANETKVDEASNLLQDGQTKAAKEKIRQVLNEQPNNIKARKVNETIERKLNENKTYYSKVNSKFSKPVSLELRDASIKTVFQLLSKAADVNFILDKDINPNTKVSVFVKNTTVDEALNNIFASSQLSKRVLNENSVLVYPNSKKPEYEEIVAKTFYLDGIDVKKAQELIKMMIKTKDIFVDEGLNILVMRDRLDAVRAAEKLLNSYDIGDPEVLLEVEVLEVSDTRASELGLSFPSQLSVGVTGAGGGGQLTFEELKNFTSKMARVSITDPTLVLKLRSTEGLSNLLANPRIRVKNHKQAKIHIGDRVPVISSTSTSTGFVSESVSYLDVGLKLEMEPSIMVSDDVTINISLEVSNIVSEFTTKSGSVSYRLGTRNAATTLRLKNGETQVLAGLINNEERTSADRVPGLASLPIIGRLFSSKNNSNNKTEIVLLITPKIIRNISPSPSLTEISLGTETGNSSAEMAGATGSSQQMNNLQPVNMEESNIDNSSNGNLVAPVPVMPIQLNIPSPPPLPDAQQPVVN